MWIATSCFSQFVKSNLSSNQYLQSIPLANRKTRVIDCTSGTLRYIVNLGPIIKWKYSFNVVVDAELQKTFLKRLERKSGESDNQPLGGDRRRIMKQLEKQREDEIMTCWTYNTTLNKIFINVKYMIHSKSLFRHNHIISENRSI